MVGCISPGRNYLRVRGEYHLAEMISKGLKELPPRARRILGEKFNLQTHDGTTSACAENTMLLDEIYRLIGNYLRVRGEYDGGDKINTFAWELPPRARRIPANSIASNPNVGTTSACAENTTRPCGILLLSRNYLRVRGEYHWLHLHKHIRWELPPRARRILISATPTLLLLGTTSACAENTSSSSGI